ncbi:hypothetical protein [Bacillus pumilus]|uniref:hypothetical protein n=1 Tax=Bacillus pumilus TaxID=1408 RepID=UPI00119D3B6B|nr:hypothetical protein [Bacillus pumilus]
MFECLSTVIIYKLFVLPVDTSTFNQCGSGSSYADCSARLTVIRKEGDALTHDKLGQRTIGLAVVMMLFIFRWHDSVY